MNYISMNKRHRELLEKQDRIDKATAEFISSGHQINVIAVQTVQDIKTRAAANVRPFGTF